MFGQMAKTTPRLWSDFDGTAVALAKKTQPRNWSKYPLAGLEGYVDFLRGVSSTGVEVAGIVSRRPDIFVRRMATARSIATLGYGEFFTDTSKIVHAGSEQAKGGFIAEQSREATVGILEDKPHKLGAVPLGVLQGSDFPTLPHHPVVLGVVAHPRSQEYIERLTEGTRSAVIGSRGRLDIQQTGTGATASLSMRSESVSLDVVQLQPYSEQAGQEFGALLLKAAS